MIEDLSQGFELIEKIGNASPLIFTMSIAALSILGNLMLAKALFGISRRYGRARGMLVAHYVKDGDEVEEAEKKVFFVLKEKL